MSVRALLHAKSAAEQEASTSEPASGGLPAGVGILLAAIVAGVVAQGGYYQPGRLLIGALTLIALAVSLGATRWSKADMTPVLIASAALALWALTRGALAEALPEATAAAATLAAAVAAALIMRRTDSAQREAAATALVGVGVLIALTGWAGVAWRLDRWAVVVERVLWRASSTITYANAAAAVLAALALLALGLLIAQPRSALRTAAVYLMLVGLGATLSRAGVIVVLVGLAVIAAFAGVRATFAAIAAPAIGAVLAVLLLVPSFPVDREPQPMLALLGLLAGLAVAVGVPRLPPIGRWAVAAAAAATAALAIGTQFGSGIADGLLANRGTFASGGRSGAIGAAFDLIKRSPWTGHGVEQARFYWTNDDFPRGAVARYTHNEYLQLLVDLGAIGLVLLVALLAAIVATVRRGRREAGLPPLWAGAVAALCALAVHSAFDFLWHLAVIPLLGMFLVGLAGPANRGHSKETPIPTLEEK